MGAAKTLARICTALSVESKPINTLDPSRARRQEPTHVRTGASHKGIRDLEPNLSTHPPIHVPSYQTTYLLLLVATYHVFHPVWTACSNPPAFQLVGAMCHVLFLRDMPPPPLKPLYLCYVLAYLEYLAGAQMVAVASLQAREASFKPLEPLV